MLLDYITSAVPFAYRAELEIGCTWFRKMEEEQDEFHPRKWVMTSLIILTIKLHFGHSF